MTLRLAVGVDPKTNLGPDIERMLLQNYSSADFEVVPIKDPGDYRTQEDIENGAKRALTKILRTPSQFYMGVCSFRVLLPHWLGSTPSHITAVTIINDRGLILIETCQDFGTYMPWSRRERVPNLPTDMLDILAAMVQETVGTP